MPKVDSLTIFFSWVGGGFWPSCGFSAGVCWFSVSDIRMLLYNQFLYSRLILKHLNTDQYKILLKTYHLECYASKHDCRTKIEELLFRVLLCGLSVKARKIFKFIFTIFDLWSVLSYLFNSSLMFCGRDASRWGNFSTMRNISAKSFCRLLLRLVLSEYAQTLPCNTSSTLATLIV